MQYATTRELQATCRVAKGDHVPRCILGYAASCCSGLWGAALRYGMLWRAFVLCVPRRQLLMRSAACAVIRCDVVQYAPTREPPVLYAALCYSPSCAAMCCDASHSCQCHTLRRATVRVALQHVVTLRVPRCSHPMRSAVGAAICGNVVQYAAIRELPVPFAARCYGRSCAAVFYDAPQRAC